MNENHRDQIASLESPEIADVLSKGFAQLYREKPNFPVTFYANWLKSHCRSSQLQRNLQQTKIEKIKTASQLELREQKAKEDIIYHQKRDKQRKESTALEFKETVSSTTHLMSLVLEYLPESLETNFNLTGCYVGELCPKRKKIQEHNFEANSQFDTENPKVIEYIGASKSHKFMIGKILPNQNGRSYEVFNISEEEPVAEEGQEGGEVKPKEIKKKYLYIPSVQRDQKMYYFKFPRLGSYACFPLRIKSCLAIETFEKGILDYKAYVKNKEELEKQYNEKLAEVTGPYEESKKKYEEFEVNEEEPNSVAEKKNLEEEFRKNEEAFIAVQGSAPKIEAMKYECVSKDYFVGCDTLGKDVEIGQQSLDNIEQQILYFKSQWEAKEAKMLLSDILQYLEEEHTFDSLEGSFREQEKSVGSMEAQIREQVGNKEKQIQFEMSVAKCAKFIKTLSEPNFQQSMNAYLNYHVHKYKEVIQITLMLLGYEKQKINLARSNSLNARKVLTKEFIEEMLEKLDQYPLRRQSSEAVQSEYKINKLLERLEKIDLEAIVKYNGWLFALTNTAKAICWSRIHCRDSKVQAFEARVKAKNEREAEIVRYGEEFEKALQVVKAELNEESLPNFNEEEWRKTYSIENIKPEELVVDELKLFLDIE